MGSKPRNTIILYLALYIPSTYNRKTLSSGPDSFYAYEAVALTIARMRYEIWDLRRVKS